MTWYEVFYNEYKVSSCFFWKKKYLKYFGDQFIDRLNAKLK